MVLEARENAGKVWYPIVWEEVKDASNVVDNDIHEEITIDTSSVFNANNDTTTGMATVIPWVNAPKLKMSTSIYVDEDVTTSVLQTIQWVWSYVDRPDEVASDIRQMQTIESRWNKEIVYYESSQWLLYSWMKVPVKWTYQIDVTYSWTSSTYWWTFEWRTPKWWWSSDTVWHTFVWPRNWADQTESFKRKFEAWEVFWIFVTMNRSDPTAFTDRPTVNFTITKL